MLYTLSLPNVLCQIQLIKNELKNIFLGKKEDN